MKRLDKTHPISFVRTVDLQNNLVGDLQGVGDELSDAIEAEFGDGFNDGGFSQGYFAGYDHGYADGFYGKDFRGIPDDNRDAVVDIPFGPDDNVKDNVSDPNIQLTGHVGVSDPNTRVGSIGQSEGVEFYLSGYQEGYSDGFEDGETKRRETMPTERFTWEIRRGDVPSETAENPNPRGPFFQR